MLEAGRPDYIWDVFIHMPAALTFPIGSRFYDWKYESEPEPYMNGRRIYHARGKLLGGSSSINGMIFQRGNPLDYERWAADPGMGAWDYAHCLPYFKKMENCLAGGDEYRGTAGPLKLERGPATNPLFTAFFEAVQQAGYALTTDVNGYRQEGFAAFDRNVYRGRRLSAARAYLHPVMNRQNLTVRTRAFVTKILFEGTRAVGVEYRHGNRVQQARAGQVILCGGAINSPQLLQLSGVGPASLLQEHGIDVIADLPGVGENMQDHLEVYVQYACKQPVSVAPALKYRNRPMVGAKWLFGRSGPGATNHFEGGGFARSNDEVAYPNLMFHFLPIAIRYDGSAPAGGHGYQVHIGPMYSDSRGSVRIVSDDPSVHPALRFNYLSTDTDRREWVEAIGVARHILSQPALDPYNGGELSPGPAVSTDEQILDWVRTGRRDGPAPFLHVRDGHPRRVCRRPGQHGGARARRAQGRRRLGDAVRHERQHLRAGHDGRREGRRHHSREPAAATGRGRVLPDHACPAEDNTAEDNRAGITKLARGTTQPGWSRRPCITPVSPGPSPRSRRLCYLAGAGAISTFPTAPFWTASCAATISSSL